MARPSPLLVPISLIQNQVAPGVTMYVLLDEPVHMTTDFALKAVSSPDLTFRPTAPTTLFPLVRRSTAIVLSTTLMFRLPSSATRHFFIVPPLTGTPDSILSP